MLIQSSYRASTSELEEEQNSRGKWNRLQNDDVVSAQNVHKKMTENSSKRIHEMASLDTNTRHGAKVYKVVMTNCGMKD